jgi:L-glutamine:2-deoxy-scyllo-inosose/3-amino-2,3-dideoxy-scyllo-inosose aminotransferase
MGENLAITGGEPVASLEWPVWPRPSGKTAQLISEVLESGRWTLSGPWRNRRSREQEFAEKFAGYHNVAYCVPTSSGTSALTIALESLGVGAGDEVIIPGLSWVASASSVLNVNARPVLADISPDSLCISPDAIEDAITERTKAIVVVHLYCSMADMDQIMAIASGHGLPVLEDCAQAHGARWRGRQAGTIGRMGTFSMQQTKLLTAGEGGAVITHDPEIADMLFQLRADGRSLAVGPLRPNEMELVPRSGVMGNNYCLSEFGAAVLSDQLEYLAQENDVRAENAALLSAGLAGIPGVRPVTPAPEITSPTYYQYAMRIDPAEFSGRSLDQICAALSAELGFPVNRCYPPLNDNPLYRPHSKRRYQLDERHTWLIDPERFKLPEAERAYREVVTVHHSFLLAPREAMAVATEAFQKVQRLAHQIPDSE